jgi:hypothetical protein
MTKLKKLLQPKRRGRVCPRVEELELRLVPTLLGQQLFPLDNPWNQDISNAPVAANSAAIIAHIGASTRLTPNWYADNPSNGSSPLYGIPFNVVHGNSTVKVNVIIDNYPGESDIVPVPIPANAVIEGDFQNGPNPNGGGYNANQRGDSHLIVWDEDNNIAYELYGVSRPTDPTLFPNTSNVELPHSDGLWHAAQETVWNMNTNTFRTLGETSADAAGLSILAGLARPDEGLTVSQGGQGVINHALRVTLPSGDINPQYIYPAAHMVATSQGPDNLPLGSRLRLANTSTIDTLINNMPPESQILARAMQQYGLIVADIGSAMYVSGASASVDANNNINLTWDLTDIFAANGLEALNAGDFQVVNLTPVVTGLSASSGMPGSSITITGQNFSGAAGNLSVFFGSTAANSVQVLSDTQLSVVVPSGSGTVDVTVQSGINETDTLSSNPNANVNAPIFGYGTSAKTPSDLFTFTASPATIVLSTGALVLGSTNRGTAGSAQTFTVSGANLTTDIILTAPAGVELSENGGVTYFTNLDLSGTGGTVPSTTILARITATAPVGPVNGMIKADSIGATEKDVGVSGTVLPATPQVTVSSVPIGYGTPLANSQLNGTATATINGQVMNVAGTFTYTSAAGTVLNAGSGQTEAVTFTPTNTTDYSSVQTTVTVNVAKATPTFSNLSAPTVTVGTASTTISGHLSANAGQQVVPAAEIVQVTLNGVAQNATLDSSDNFSTTFATSSLTVAGSPYAIGFIYTGDANFNPATGNSTLTVAGPFVAPHDFVFWRDHPNLWPVTSLPLGGITYTNTELLALLATKPAGDARIVLARQLIAAELNIANGSNPAPIQPTIATANNLLSGIGKITPGSPKVKLSSSLGQLMLNTAATLALYNG